MNHDAIETEVSIPATKRGKSSAYKPLTRLTPRHHRMIEMHLAGLKNTEIAEAFSIAPCRVSIILRNPTVEAYLHELREAADQELKNLLPAAVGILRRALDDPDPKVALRATDEIFRVLGKYREEMAPQETAEDVIARALAIMKTQAETVRDVTRERNMRVINAGAQPESGG